MHQPGIRIKGSDRQEDLFVDGVVEGKLSSHTKQLPDNWTERHVKADVLAREVIVGGKIEGKVTGRDKFTVSTGQLRESADGSPSD